MDVDQPQAHLDDNIPDSTVALEQLLHVPVPGVIGDVSQVDLVIAHLKNKD